MHYQGGPDPALRGVSIRVPVGEGLVVTGPEGCGRTTLVRALVGLVRPTAGSVTVLGGSPADSAVRRRVGYAPQSTPFPRTQRAGDALALVADIRGVPRADIASAARRVGLEADLRTRVGGLEMEDVRRLSLACAVMGDPEALVLDDPWEFPETVDILTAALSRGATVLVATPDPGGFPVLLGHTVTLDAGVVV